MARVYEVGFKIGANMASSFAKTMASAGGALGELNKRMAEMGRQQAGTQRVIELRQSLEKTSREFTDAKQKADALGAAIAKTNNPTKAMVREYDRAQAAVEKARGKMQQQAATLREVSREAGATGKSTAQLVQEQNKLAEASQRAANAQASLQKNIAAQQANKAKRGELRGQMLGAVALGSTLYAPTKVAMDFEAAMSKVGAVSRASEEEVAALTKTARELGASTVWSASQAAEGMTYLAMAGFSTNETISAMPGMLALASAAGSDLGTTADIASNMLSGFRLSTEEMGRVADVMANTFTASNTSLESLGETMGYVAPIAAEAGVSLEQAAAMAGLLGDNAIQGGQAGTALRSIINRMAGPPTEAAKALDKLNISTKDGAGNLRDMSEILADVNKATATLGSADKLEIFKQIAGQEAGSAFAVLVNEAGKGNLQKFTENVAEAGAAQRVSAEMTNNARGAITQFQSAMEAVSITIGNVLLPVVADMATRAADLALRFQSFADANPKLIKTLVLVTAGLIAFKVAAIAGGYAFTFIRGAALTAQGAFLSVRTAYLLFSKALVSQQSKQVAASVATKAMAAAQYALNTALLANPIGLVIAGVAGLIAIGVALYKHWDVVSAFLGGVWQGLKDGFAPLAESFSALSPVLGVLKTAVGWVSDAFSTLLGWFSKTEHSAETLEAAAGYGQVFGQVIAKAFEMATFFPRKFIELIGWVATNITELPALVGGAITSLTEIITSIDFFEHGRAILTTLTDGIKAAAAAPVEAVKGALAKVREYLPFSDAKVGPLSELTFSGMQILNTLKDGILAAASAPVEAIKGALAKVRDYLPFSDAKVGPLSELTYSGAQVMATLGGGMAEAANMPTIEMGAALEGVQAAIAESNAEQAGGKVVDFASGIMRGGNTTNNTAAPSVTINQTITVGGGGDAYEQAKRGASEGAQDIVAEIKKALSREGRLSYG